MLIQTAISIVNGGWLPNHLLIIGIAARNTEIVNLVGQAIARKFLKIFIAPSILNSTRYRLSLLLITLNTTNTNVISEIHDSMN